MKFISKITKMLTKTKFSPKLLKPLLRIAEPIIGFIIAAVVILLLHEWVKSYKNNREGVENKSDDDRYMLKSEVVPPVCPKCPDSSVCPKQEECPPCPACERCPEPSFTCKKVPNYQSNALENDHSLPLSYLNSFEQF
jgi:hypothetical protein